MKKIKDELSQGSQRNYLFSKAINEAWHFSPLEW